MIAALLLGLAALDRGSSPTGLPSQFEDVVITNVSAPTALAFTPDKRMLITSQSGRLRIYRNGSLLSTPALDISGKVCGDFERGLLGVAVDPSFSSNHYIYLYYTFKKFSGCPYNTSQAPVNRVSRFTLGNNDLVNPATELVLVDNMPSPGGNHNAGDVNFGKDGYLYISIGDGGCQIDNSGACAGANQNARKRNVLTGKILRITKTGGIPSGNPFTGSNSGRCNETGRTSQTHCQETWLWGLRNPFRFAVDPGSSRIYINDVGQGSWEEIDSSVAGSDYGWNICEGFHLTSSSTACPAGSNGFRNPIFEYGHGSCNSITGGAFVPKGIWPEAYDGAFLFSDYTCGRIWRLSGSSRIEFQTGGSPIHLEFGPYQSTQALYYASLGGQIHRVRYTGQANRDPVAVAEADKMFGPLPLTVHFDCAESDDPDNDPLTYDWNFGDGTPHSTSCAPTHQYTTAAKRTVTLTVRDDRGGSDTDTITIHAGNTPPTVTITSPTASHLYRVGETITLSATASDAQDGTVQSSQLTWTVTLHHGNHTHPMVPATRGNNVRFQTRPPEDLAAATNSYLEIKVTAKDDDGLTKTVSQNLNPKKVTITLNTNPPGLYVTVNNVRKFSGASFTSWQGYDLQVNAPSQLSQNGQGWTYASWSDGGARAHPIDTPATNASFTANFVATHHPGFVPVADAYVVNGHPNSNYGLSTQLISDYGPTSTSETYLKFNVAGLSGSISTAKIWVYVANGTGDGPAVYRTSNSWSETGITWNHRPAKIGGARNDRDNISTGTWVSYDVTPWVTGNGAYSFVLAGQSSDGLAMNSRQAGNRWPRLEITTTGGSSDVTPPSVPTNVRFDTPLSSKVIVRWNASSDNVGVASYDVFRDGLFLTTVDDSTRYYSDTSVHQLETYSYRVRSRDAAGNISALSSPVSVTTPIQTFSYTFSPTDDARVEQAHATSNYGSSSQLKAEGGDDPGVRSFLKFNVGNLIGNIQSAKLRVFIPATSAYGTTNGPRVYKASSAWSEGSVTWNTKPALLTGGRDDKSALSAGTWVEFDVKPFIKENAKSTIVIISSSNDSVVFNSSESSSNRPRLMIVTSMAAATSAEAPPVEQEPVDGTKPLPSPTPTVEATATATAGPSTTAEAQPSATASSAIPFADGFETGDLSAWSKVDGLTVQQQTVDNGLYSARSANNGDDIQPGKPSFAEKSLNSEETNLFASARYQVKQQGDDSVTLLTLQTKENQPIVYVFLTSDHKLAYQFAGASQPVVIEDVKPEEWHSLQVHLAINGANSQIELWHDGKLLRRDPDQFGDIKIGAIQLGEQRDGRTYEIFFDQIVVDRQCIGICSTELVTPTPSAEAPTTAPEPTATEIVEPTQPPTEAPPAPTNTPEPTATSAPPTETAVPPPTETPVPAETVEAGG